MPENALSGNRRIELCEKSKLRNGSCDVAKAYNRMHWVKVIKTEAILFSSCVFLLWYE